MKAIVHVALKNGVLDPQGKAVADTLARMGYKEV
ncbi:MAG TPA: phosphoribosylformylglycinamidine synthase, partial [Hyphomonas sp.]|nr:phosphoribosylformylglycinamidine synthase [Hyphomonas sp.]